ncbi:OmpA-family protein [Taylorella asinigenitalis 14/45]|uniref:Outer membrane protein ImpK/VasF n=2 Tax=Taylorella asinigenitalis TaxID=84590 RepID=G4QD61_TAYAM|nr:DotU family type VI secretion system protein [Taylorella asinigenitalis]AEP35878.1 Outer membrane protein ImpK/VasF [Taylorella asinigenitalis MCE3]CCG20035.1 OmpA-family protein [Taylorella asinigenitalis 14/45]
MSSRDYVDSKMGPWGQIHQQRYDESNKIRPDNFVISGSNPLVAAANPLLTLLPQIRFSQHHDNVDMLRELLVEEVRQFEVRAQEKGISKETILGARYCLCTAIDEACAMAPWGQQGLWSGKSLLVTYHNETWGGEKFFQLLRKLSQNPENHIDLLELMYFCLMLGFEGRFRVIENGRSQLETLKQRLLLIIKKVRGSYPITLSPNWKGDEIINKIKRLPIPLWVVAIFGFALAVLSYILFSWLLGGKSDEVAYDIVKIKPPAMQIAVPVRVVRQEAPKRLAQFLEAEIRENLMTVRDESDRSVVELRGDELFESGSAEIKKKFETVVNRLGDALDETEGNILITGHTDNRPIKTIRFPSNWDLSQARADAVAKIIESRLTQKNRIRAEGKADTMPVKPNDTAENRARNRRVEITLLIPAQTKKARPTTPYIVPTPDGTKTINPDQ